MGNVSDSVQQIRTEDVVDAGVTALHAFSFIVKNPEEDGDAEFSSESSSIGADASASSFEGGEEGQVKLEEEAATTFVSLDSLEHSLPIKRGLSAFFSGKSKSFASLSDASAFTAKDLVKTENPFNKRRRIHMANKASWSRRASCSSLLVSSPSEVKEEGEKGEQEEGTESPMAPLSNRSDGRGSNTTFKPPRSFSLSDLQNGCTNLSSLL